MIALKMLLAAIAFVLLIGPLNAHANIIYNWTGDCQGIAPVFNTGCTGQATLHVVTTDAYIPGQVLFGDTPHVLLEALYSDSTLTFDLGIQWPSSGESFLLPASQPGDGFFSLTEQTFKSNAQGVWQFEGETQEFPGCFRPGGPDSFCTYKAIGVNGVFTRVVPIPPTLVLLGVGLAGLVLYRRRWLG